MFLQLRKVKPALLVTAACLFGLAVAGCDDHVQITRDPDVRINRGMTWAWRPATEAKATRDTRPVVSRDVMPGRDSVTREDDPNAEIVRDRVRNSIAQTLTSKGLKQVSDPAAADFLVDYHFAVERRSATVPVGYGGYPGLVCGPYGCYQGWGWGPPGYGYERIPFREGTIVFDFLQQSTKHLVYRAVGQKPVRQDTFSLTQDEINDLVHHLMKDLKVRK